MKMSETLLWRDFSLFNRISPYNFLRIQSIKSVANTANQNHKKALEQCSKAFLITYSML